jgi:hypothetical protein
MEPGAPWSSCASGAVLTFIKGKQYPQVTLQLNKF